LVVGQAGSGGGIRVSSGPGVGINVSNSGAGAIGVSADTKAGGAVAPLGTNETDAKFANAIQGQANGFTKETIGVWGITRSLKASGRGVTMVRAAPCGLRTRGRRGSLGR
jgi:hypothetical protein